MSGMDDGSILSTIHQLVAEERELASRNGHTPDERARLRSVEESLDQCWDLLRQRRARREFGEDPDGAQVRPISDVEGYVQ
jgi:Protein of unknown function (DUF2630)